MNTENLISLLGIPAIIGIGWLFSTDRKRFPWRVVCWGIILQLIFAVLVLRTAPGRALFAFLNDLITGLLNFTIEGSVFVFNALAVPMDQSPWQGSFGTGTKSLGFFFAFQVLTTIIFFSSLMSVAYYLGFMQKIVEFFAKIMNITMGTSGAESLSASANIFVGQTEAPLVIRPYVEKMTMSELMAVMTGGFATVAGGVMGAYVFFLKPYFPNIAGHLISASVLSAPAALVMAKVMLPETEEPVTRGEVKMAVEVKDVNVLDAAAGGASSGMTLALNVAAMLIAFTALIAMVNFGLDWVGDHLARFFSGKPHEILSNLTLQNILGYLHMPLAWIMGVPVKDCFLVGRLLGEKLVLTEFFAYIDLKTLLADPAVSLDPRSVVIVTYGLCGFANFASIAIQIGGISGIAPSRRGDLAKLGMRAMVAGALAAYLTGNVAGVFYNGETILKPTAAPPAAVSEASEANIEPAK
ncbi:MAG: NupC/NupG family nucleoside CNT transporter [Candidatus Hydrogenedentota bacterium]|nr:MAG: NupC/NupG family nucleoside CNT transporter [Candidatus Hydrogenedentota bacterium]